MEDKKTLVIDKGVKVIEPNAHVNQKIDELIISDTVEEIGFGAFSSNNLTEITIPRSVKKIDSLAFANNKLTSIFIPNTVESFGKSVFACNNLENVIIEDGVKKIPEEMFYNNKKINCIKIPSTVTEIGKNAFTNVDVYYDGVKISKAEISSYGCEKIIDLAKKKVKPDGFNYEKPNVLKHEEPDREPSDKKQVEVKDEETKTTLSDGNEKLKSFVLNEAQNQSSNLLKLIDEKTRTLKKLKDLLDSKYREISELEKDYNFVLQVKKAVSENLTELRQFNGMIAKNDDKEKLKTSLLILDEADKELIRKSEMINACNLVLFELKNSINIIIKEIEKLIAEYNMIIETSNIVSNEYDENKKRM